MRVCEVCGKVFVSQRKKYCSYECKAIGAEPQEDRITYKTYQSIKDEYKRFRKAFAYYENRPRTEKGKLWLLRVFSYAMVYLGYSVHQTSKVVLRHHSTVIRHLRNITEDEKIIAKEFANNRDYVYCEKKQENKLNIWYGR